MENHHVQWVNPLFLWPCSIAMLVITRGYRKLPSEIWGDQLICNEGWQWDEKFEGNFTRYGDIPSDKLT